MAEESKAQPDVGTLDMGLTSRAETKVTLDIEDAPFLQEAEAPPPVPAERSDIVLDAKPTEDDEAAARRKKKKKMIIMGGSALVLIMAVAVWWFLLRTPPPKPVVLEPEIIKVPSPPTTAKAADYIVEFAPYWIELPDGKGGVVFLVCKFAAVTKSEVLTQEAQNKMVTLRDAVYYYLKNKPYHFLIDPANVTTIKKDLASVLSGYLAGGQIDDMLFESYLGK